MKSDMLTNEPDQNITHTEVSGKHITSLVREGKIIHTGEISLPPFCEYNHGVLIVIKLIMTGFFHVRCKVIDARTSPQVKSLLLLPRHET